MSSCNSRAVAELENELFAFASQDLEKILFDADNPEVDVICKSMCKTTAVALLLTHYLVLLVTSDILRPKLETLYNTLKRIKYMGSTTTFKWCTLIDEIKYFQWSIAFNNYPNLPCELTLIISLPSKTGAPKESSPFPRTCESFSHVKVKKGSYCVFD